MNIIDWLKSQGDSMVDAAQSSVRNLLFDFGKKCDELERLYAAHYYAWQEMGTAYPFNAYLIKLGDAITHERQARMLIMRALNLVGALPKDYGIPLIGLNLDEVKKINPQFVGLPPAVFLGATLLLTVALLADLIGVLLAEKAAYDLFGALVSQYKAEGMTQAQAEAKAKATMAEIKKESGFDIGGTLDSIGSLVKIGGLIYVAKEFFGD